LVDQPTTNNHRKDEMKELFANVLITALVIHLALILICVQRVWRGETSLDRLVAADVIGTLILAIFVILALIAGDLLYVDVALGMAALSFVGTIALARYIVNRQMF
jgi:multisubunit Na+/H+ antiporter MnhF subunit